jgi:diguanylate cyclase (GGDEF)-like protein
VRYGGDEYVMVLLGSDGPAAQRIAERIRGAVDEHRFLRAEGLAVPLTVCVGVAAFPEHGTDQQQLLEAADRAMYRGKQSTRNAVQMAEPLLPDPKSD